MYQSSCTGEKYVCPICGQFARRTYQGILRHIGEVHRFSPDFHITCGLGCTSGEKCPATYTKYESFRSHVYKKHREELSDSVQYPAELEGDDGNDRGGVSLQDDFLGEEGEDFCPSSSAATEGDMSVKHAAALFILKCMEERRISQVSTIKIILARRDFRESLKK